MPYLIFFTLKSYLETITVQAPHPPSAQPNFVPLSPTVDLQQFHYKHLAKIILFQHS